MGFLLKLKACNKAFLFFRNHNKFYGEDVGTVPGGNAVGQDREKNTKLNEIRN